MGGDISANNPDVGDVPPIYKRTDLSDQLWIGHLDAETAKTIMETCEPKALGLTPPVRQRAHLYAFVRELPSDSEILRWDTDHQLTAAIAISRLIRPTSIGFAHAARVGIESGVVREVLPAEIRGISREAFLSPNRARKSNSTTVWRTLSDWPFSEACRTRSSRVSSIRMTESAIAGQFDTTPQ
jgi:hypothetical protein